MKKNIIKRFRTIKYKTNKIYTNSEIKGVKNSLIQLIGKLRLLSEK